MRIAAYLLVLIMVAASIAFADPGYAQFEWECSVKRDGEFVSQPVLRGVECVTPFVGLKGFENEVIPRRIESAFELVLRKAGILIIEYDKGKTLECPGLMVNVSVLENGSCISFISTCELAEIATVSRGGQKCHVLSAITWNKSSVYGELGTTYSKTDLVTQEVRACADAFANEFLAANPPKGPVTESRLPEKAQEKPEAKSD